MTSRSLPGSNRAFTRALAVAVVVSFAVTLWLVGRPAAILTTILQVAAFIAPGLGLVRAVSGPSTGWLPMVAFGPAIGFGASSLVLTGLWMAGLRGLWILAAAPLIAAALLLPFASRLRGRWQLPVTVEGDRRALLALMLLVPLVVSAPFANVGRQLPEGQAYRAYFTADYVWRRAVVTELAKADALPVNPFFRDDTLHYYWMPHLAAGVAYRGTGANLDDLLLVHSVVVDAGFVAFLYGLARWFVRRPGAAAAGVAMALLATSYEGLYSLVLHWQKGVPLSLVRYVNIDAVSRWELGGMPIDGLQRVLFYQPHHAIGYVLGFLGLLCVCGRVRRHDPAAMAVAGSLLGLSTLVSSFAGLMFTAASALYEACSVLRHREWWRGVVHASAAALPLVLAAALVTALEYVDHGGPIVSVGANPVAFHRVMASTLLSFGPVLLVTILAACIAVRADLTRMSLFIALIVTCTFFYFFVDIRDHQDVYVGWRVGHLSFIAFAALAAIVVDWALGLSPRSRAGVLVCLGIACLAALPTTAIDIYNTQDIYNWGKGPGFTWTLLLSPDEQDAFRWIKMHTRPDAVFQVDPIERDVQGWAYIPAFAERRLAAGLPISMVPLEKYRQASAMAAWIFETSSAASAHEIARKNRIDYLVVGSPERRRHPGVQARFDEAPEYLDRVFENAEISIYRVR